MKNLLVVASALLLAAGSARAQSTFQLSNVQFTTSAGGTTSIGTLSGTFTTNSALTAITSYNITASAAGAFSGFTYTPMDSVVSAATLPSQYFQIDSTGYVDELRIFFNSPLTASGTTISTASSYEHEPSGGNRFLSGSIIAATATSAVPEVSTWATMLVGAGLAGGALRRRRTIAAKIHFA